MSFQIVMDTDLKSKASSWMSIAGEPLSADKAVLKLYAGILPASEQGNVIIHEATNAL